MELCNSPERLIAVFKQLFTRGALASPIESSKALANAWQQASPSNEKFRRSLHRTVAANVQVFPERGVCSGITDVQRVRCVRRRSERRTRNQNV